MSSHPNPSDRADGEGERGQPCRRVATEPPAAAAAEHETIASGATMHEAAATIAAVASEALPEKMVAPKAADTNGMPGTTRDAADAGSEPETARAGAGGRSGAAEAASGVRDEREPTSAPWHSRRQASLLSTRHGRVLQLLISNPSARNALSPDMYATARQALRDAAEDAGIGAIVIAGDGSTFCAGGNLNRLLANRSQPPAVQRDSIEGLHGWVRALQSCDKPVIAAVEGAAAGAGCSIALACDLIVAASDARFAMSYVKVGLSPDGGATWTAMRLLPVQTAMQLLIEGDVLPAARLHALGVVNALTAPGEALQAAMLRAAQLAAGPSRTIARIKRLARAARSNDFVQQLDLERDGFVDALHAAEAAEGIAAFLEKRPPRWH